VTVIEHTPTGDAFPLASETDGSRLGAGYSFSRYRRVLVAHHTYSRPVWT